MNILVVDDERAARLDLITQLRRVVPDAIITEADSRPSAEHALGADRFDVVFLDIDLGNANGFEILPALPAATPVVFVTAYAEHAVRAFEADAVDYLLKPVESERLAATLQRVRAHVHTPLPSRNFAADDWLFLATTPVPVFVQVKSIACITAEGDYTAVHTTERARWFIKRSIREWAERLGSAQFARIHRGTIVNLECVSALTPRPTGGYTVHLRGIDEPVIMSRSYARALSGTMGI